MRIAENIPVQYHNYPAAATSFQKKRILYTQQIENAPDRSRRIDKSAENAWDLSIPSEHFRVFRENFRSTDTQFF
jgi:hypothetical protein